MSAPPLHLSDAHRRLLTAWIRAGTTPQRVVKRARIVLLAADGASARTTAHALGIAVRTATLWRRRFMDGGPHALWRDAPGRGRKTSLDADAVSRMRSLLASPPPGAARWSIRRLADASGLSRASVHRLLRAGDLAADVEPRSRTRRRQIVAATPAIDELPV